MASETPHGQPLAALRDVAAQWGMPIHEYAAIYYGDVNRWRRDMQWKRDTIDTALADRPRAEAHVRLSSDIIHISIRRDGSEILYRTHRLHVGYDDIRDVTAGLPTTIALTGWAPVRHDVPIIRTGRYTAIADVAEISYDVLDVNISEAEERRRADAAIHTNRDPIGELFPHVPPQGNPFGGMR